MKKSSLFILISSAAILFLPSCKAARLIAQHQSPRLSMELASYIKGTCGEKCTVISHDDIYGYDRNVVFHLKSDERDIEFIIYAKRQEDGSYKFQTDYMNAVRDLYADEIAELFEDFDYSSRPGVLLSDSDEIVPLSEAIVEANAIFRRELDYNSETFLKEYNFGTIPVFGKTGPGKYDYNKTITEFIIDGSVLDKQQIESQIRTELSRKIKDEILDAQFYSDLTEEIDAIHKTRLNHIYLNGEEMLYDTKLSSYSNFAHTTDDYCYAFYDEDTDSYMMSIDYGYLSESSSFPLIISEYAHHLGGDYEALTPPGYGSRKIKAAWTVDGHSYASSCIFSDNKANRFTVIKDGKKLDITPHEGKDCFTVSLTVDDFCKLFDLTYEIQEAEDAIYFHQ